MVNYLENYEAVFNRTLCRHLDSSMIHEIIDLLMKLLRGESTASEYLSKPSRILWMHDTYEGIYQITHL